MDPAQLIAQLARQDRLPVEAIRAAGEDRAQAVPLFIDAIERFVSGDHFARDALFFIFHMLGDWRETSAYRPLARLLRCPPDSLDAVFGGAVTETTHRVMAAVFDGDPGPLYEVILDPEADEFVRARMLEAIAMVTVSGAMSRDEAARFLRTCYFDIQPQDECFVWNGWQSAVAWLSLADLKPLVEQAFARGFLNPTWLEIHHFERDLQEAIADPAAMLKRRSREYTLFGDTIEELSTWYCFRPKPPKQETSNDAARQLLPLLTGPAFNIHRRVGRNDPCPCGSGKKFKKCCLTAAAGPWATQA